MHTWLLILSSRWVRFPSLSLSLASYKTMPRSYTPRVVFFYLPVGGTLSSCGFAPSFTPPSTSAAGIVEEVCFDWIKCNFRVPSTAFSLERLSAKPISCCKLWMELMRSRRRRRDFYIFVVTLRALYLVMLVRILLAHQKSSDGGYFVNWKLSVLSLCIFQRYRTFFFWKLCD